MKHLQEAVVIKSTKYVCRYAQMCDANEYIITCKNDY